MFVVWLFPAISTVTKKALGDSTAFNCPSELRIQKFPIVLKSTRRRKFHTISCGTTSILVFWSEHFYKAMVQVKRFLRETQWLYLNFCDDRVYSNIDNDNNKWAHIPHIYILHMVYGSVWPAYTQKPTHTRPKSEESQAHSDVEEEDVSKYENNLDEL